MTILPKQSGAPTLRLGRDLKPPVLAGVASASIFVIAILAWQRYPALVPIGLIVLIGTFSGAVFIASEVVILIRILRRSQGGVTRHLGARVLPLRSILTPVALLLALNAAFLYFGRPHPDLYVILAANAGGIVSWILVLRYTRGPE